MKYLSLIFLFCTIQTFAQSDPVFRIDSLPVRGIILDKGWKWHAGDDLEWTKEKFDDSNWESVNPTKDIKALTQLWSNEICWFRLRFNLEKDLNERFLTLMVVQNGASEIYLDGERIGGFGKVSNQADQVLALSPRLGSNIQLPMLDSGEHLLAVRYAVQKNLHYTKFAIRINYCLSLRLFEKNDFVHFIINELTPYFEFSRLGVFLILSLIHMILYWFNPKDRANLFFFLFTIFNIVGLIFSALVFRHVDLVSTKMYIWIIISTCYSLGFCSFLTAIYLIFKRTFSLTYWFLILYSILGLIFYYFNYDYGFNIGVNGANLLASAESIRVTLLASRKKLRGSGIILVGIACYLIFISLFYLFVFGIINAGPNWIYGHFAFSIGAISWSVATSIYLALESSFNSLSLTQKLNEVESLSKRMLEQEQEKQEILATQNETLERQVAERTAQLQASQAQLIQREKLASLGELTAGIAHEIQNPLNFVNNFAEVSAEMAAEMKEEMDKGETEEAKFIADDLILNLQKINHHGKRASSIVKNMLEHSRSSTGEKALTNLNTLLDECLRLSYHGMRAQEKDFQAEYSLDLEAELPEVVVVAQDIGRVLLNLFNNAFYEVYKKRRQLPAETAYAPKVNASTRKTEQGIEIRISDNGSGIPEAIRDKIFQPFFTTKPTGEGTGLGLSLAYDIITKGHGGSLALDAQPSEGCGFIITLPL